MSTRSIVRIESEGLDLKHDPINLDRNKLTKAENVYNRSDKTLRSREGYSQALAMANTHSLWARGDVSLFASGTTLYRFDAGTALATAVGTLNSTAKLDYLWLNGVVMATSVTDGFIFNPADSSVYDLSTFNPGTAGITLDNMTAEQLALLFKEPIPNGQFLTFLAPHVIVASGAELRWSDPYVAEYSDQRFNRIPLPNTITMLRAVDDGLWVGQGTEVAFIQGRTPEEYVYNKVANVSVVPGTAVSSSAEELGIDGAQGAVVVFSTDDGVKVGTNGGGLLDMNGDGISLGAGQTGAGIIVDESGETLYIGVTPNTATNRYSGRVIAVDSQTF